MSDNPYPPIPAGFHRWEPRPHGWKSEGDVKYAFLNHRLPDPKWQEMPGTMKTFGDPECDYLEAVRDEPGSTVEAEPAARVSRVEPGEPPAERPTPRTDAVVEGLSPRTGGITFADLAKMHQHAVILERELADALAWKESAIQVESQWDCQEVGRLLGVPLGRDIRPAIEPGIRDLLSRLVQEDQRNQRVLALLKKAREYSAGMDMAAYAAIQDAINELTLR